MEQNNTVGKNWYTAEELKTIKKSDYYRENLVKYLGENIIMDVPYYEFKHYKEDKNRACLREAKVIQIGDKILADNDVIKIEHIWVAIKKSVRIDSRKPLRVFGVPYEYAHLSGNQIVRNIGLSVRSVTQSCFSPLW